MSALSIFTCTQAAGNGTTTTYTGTITSGASPLVSGMPIIVTGFVTHTGFNGTFIINGGNLTTTFTAANATNATDVHAATATVDPEANAVQPGAICNPIGYGYTPRDAYPILLPYGNFIPGTLPGSGQIISF